MRKKMLAVMVFILVLLLSACDEDNTGAVETDPELASLPPATILPEPVETTPGPDASEAPKTTQAPSADDEIAAELYLDFLSENYHLLMETSFGSIAGIGFIDLDLDGSREMILFDAGASASMGANIFSIVDGRVQCISANMEPIGEAFGGAATSGISISANFMESFRLLEEDDTGKQFFAVESANANVESSYSEMIRFGSEDGVLTLTSVFYRYEEYDEETGDVILQKFRVGSTDALLSGYISFVENFYADHTDLGLECTGVFIWEDGEYTENYENFMAMAERALALSALNRVS